MGAPIFYREVNLPFLEAVKDPSRIRWRFGTIDSEEPPPVVLEKLPVCGNCHSFSQDGRTAGHGRGLCQQQRVLRHYGVAKNMALASSEIMTWDNYRPEDRQKTFGLLSQVSPDGQVGGQHRKGQIGLRGQTRPGLLATVFPDQGHSGHLPPEQRHLPVVARGR